MARSGNSAPITSAADADVRAPDGNCGRDSLTTGAVVPGATSSANTAKASPAPLFSASTCTSQPAGTRSLGMPGYAKNETGDLAPDQHQMLDTVQLRRGGLGEVTQPLDGR